MVGFSLNKVKKEVLTKLKKGDLVRIFLDGGVNFYAKINRRISDGIEIEQYNKNGSTNLFEAYPGFISYSSIAGFLRVTENEVLGIKEKETGLVSYLNRYIRVGTSINVFMGNCSRFINEGFVLNPYVHRRLEDDLLEFKKESLLVVGSDVKFIMPSSSDEMQAHIEVWNKEVKEKKAEEKKKKEG